VRAVDTGVADRARARDAGETDRDTDRAVSAEEVAGAAPGPAVRAVDTGVAERARDRDAGETDRDTERAVTAVDTGGV